MMEDDLKKALRAIDGTDAIRDIRKDVVMSHILSAWAKSKASNIDVDSLFEEINDMLEEIEFTPNGMNLDGMQGIEENKNLRMRIVSVRGRLMGISNKLAYFDSLAGRVMVKATSYLLTSDILPDKKLSVKQTEALFQVALEEVSTSIEDISFLKGRLTLALNECNEKTRALDSWINLHKQYMFFTRPGGLNDEADPPPRKNKNKNRNRSL